jgi:predicted NUDIX family NTP pyrophosphohydrolase
VAPTSAGLLLFRRTTDDGIEVLVGHMGGPFWARKDAGAWTIPKGEPSPGEAPYAAALREFEEELGSPPPASDVPDLDLGTIRQKSGKLVSAWAREGDFDVAGAVSNTVEIEWPPRSGRRLEVPEIDRVGWFSPAEAGALVVAGQAGLIERLTALLVR